MTRPTVRSRKLYRSYIEAFVFAVFLGLLIRVFVLTPYKIPSSAMIPTLLPGDYVFVYKLPYGLKLPGLDKIGQIQRIQRGDVVLFSYPKSPETRFLKRVIALPGDTIQIQGHSLFVNGQLVEKLPIEPSALSQFRSKEMLDFFSEKLDGKSYLVSFSKQIEKSDFGPTVVPQGEVFLIGDNRDGSDDSRYWGTVPFGNLDGRVWFVWFSFDLDRAELRWDRFFKSID